MLAQKILLNYYNKIASIIITMAGGMIVSRILGPGPIGVFAYSLSLASSIAFLTDFGLGTAHIKFISEGKPSKEYFSTFALLRLSFISGYLIFSLSALIFANKYNLLNTSTPELTYVILICIIAICISQVYEIVNAHLLGKTQQAKQEFPKFITTLLVQPLRVLSSFFGFSSTGLAVSHLTSTLAVAPVYYKYIKDEFSFSFNSAIAREYFKLGLPVLVIAISMSVTEYLDKVFIQNYSDSVQVGYYSFSQSISGILRTGFQSVGLLFFPTFSQYIYNKEPEKVFLLIEKYEKLLVFLILPLFIIVFYLSPEISLVMGGGKFISSAPVLALMTLSAFIFGYYHTYDNLLAGLRKFKAVSVIAVIKSSFFLFLVYLLSHTNSQYAALTVAGAILVTNFIFGNVSKYYSQKIVLKTYHTYFRNILLANLAIFVLSILLLLVLNHFLPENICRFIVLLFSMILFFLNLYFRGLIKPSGIQKLKEYLSLSKLIDYFKNEKAIK